MAYQSQIRLGVVYLLEPAEATAFVIVEKVKLMTWQIQVWKVSARGWVRV